MDHELARNAPCNRRNNSTIRCLGISVHCLYSLLIPKVQVSLCTWQSHIWWSDSWYHHPANLPSCQFPDDTPASCLCCSWWGPVCRVVSRTRSWWRCSLFRVMEGQKRWEHLLQLLHSSWVWVSLRWNFLWKSCNWWKNNSTLASSLLHQFPCHSKLWKRWLGAHQQDQSNKHPREGEEEFDWWGAGTREPLTIE